VDSIGTPTFPRGLEGVIAATNGLSFIDGQNGILEYVGIPIEELAENSTFEEVCFLLLYGRLPRSDEFASFLKRLSEHRELPPFLYELLRKTPPTAHPMDLLRTSVSALGFFDPGFEENEEERLSRAIRLISLFPVIIATFARIREGKDPIPSRRDLSQAANFLYLLRGTAPSSEEARVLDVALILHADHGLNASTFASMVTASTLADLYGSITTGISTLRGPLHGGANEAVMRALREIRDSGDPQGWVERAIEEKRKIMGFGHRVYKTWDPRAKILKKYADTLTRGHKNRPLFELAERVETLVIERVGDKGIYPNVDFYSGIVYDSLGIPEDLFTPLFAIARVPGWCGHIIEYTRDNRIFRPKGLYVGPRNQRYLSLSERP
jgi:citrate synthase